MDKLNSIQQFFALIGCDFQCYDIGRTIYALDKATLMDFEQSLIPCTTPFLQHTWLAFLFWPITETHTNAGNTDNSPAQTPDTQHVWFLKLPLDEQARLNLAARDDFLHRLYEALTQYLEAKQSSTADSQQQTRLQALEKTMQDNPYGFQPKPEQMANFHALAQKHLELPPSQYYQPAQAWMAGQTEFKHWEALGFQGLADFAARLDEDFQGQSNEHWLIKGLTHPKPVLPIPPFQALSNCLENYPLSRSLSEAVFERGRYELNQQNTEADLAAICASAIRATAQSVLTDEQAVFILQILQSPIGHHIEVLAAISGRCWQQLKQYEVLLPYLEALAQTEHGQGAFNAILSDLMFIPGMRESILHAFRSPERSESLSRSIGEFFSRLQRTGQP